MREHDENVINKIDKKSDWLNKSKRELVFNFKGWNGDDIEKEKERERRVEFKEEIQQEKERKDESYLEKCSDAIRPE